MTDLPLPVLQAGSDREILRSLQSYLYRLVEQLNNTVTSEAAAAVPPSSHITPERQFSAIKGLIIKSADIINAYSDAIEKKLRGSYVAESDFGIYKEQTAAVLSANAKELTLLYENTESIENALGQIESSLARIDARIKAGLLYYANDGTAVYGLEIGQRSVVDGTEVFDKFARFTADRLSFFDQNDIEVAYISDYKLYITNAEIKGDLRLGGYMLESRNGLAFRWSGEQ